MVLGDMIVYAKGGKQNLYRETRATMEDLSAAVDRVQEVYGSGEKLDKLLASWSIALKGVIGLP